MDIEDGRDWNLPPVTPVPKTDSDSIIGDDEFRTSPRSESADTYPKGQQHDDCDESPTGETRCGRFGWDKTLQKCRDDAHDQRPTHNPEPSAHQPEVVALHHGKNTLLRELWQAA